MRKFKDGGISICFHCHLQLVRVKGGFIFATILDPDGRELRVHKDCVKQSLGHGYRELEVKEPRPCTPSKS